MDAEMTTLQHKLFELAANYMAASEFEELCGSIRQLNCVELRQNIKAFSLVYPEKTT